MLLYKLKKQPLSWHLIAASICLVIASGGAAFSLVQAEGRLRSLESELANAQQGTRHPTDTALATKLNFTHGLPSKTKSDDIIRDIGKFANATNVQIESIHVRSREATESEFGSVEFTITLNGDYSASKAWLSALLARYQALALNTLSMRQSVQDTFRLESQTSLILYARN